MHGLVVFSSSGWLVGQMTAPMLQMTSEPQLMCKASALHLESNLWTSCL